MAFDPRSWNIRTKLFSLPAALLAAMLGLVGFADFQAQRVADRVADLDAFAATQAQVDGAGQALETMRRAVRDFVAVDDMRAMALFETRIADIEAYLEHPPQLQALETLRVLAAAARDLKTAGVRLKAAEAHMAPAEDALINSNKAFGVKALAVFNPTVALSAQKLDTLLTLVRLDNWRGRMKKDPGSLTLNADVANAAAQLEAMQGEGGGGELKDMVAPMKAQLANYAAATAETLAATGLVDDVYRWKVEPQIEALQAALAAQRRSAERDFNATRASVVSTIAQSNRLQIGVAALTLALGALFSFLLTRSIVRPLNGLTEGLRKLAGGDLDVVLPALGRSDEIGDIAAQAEGLKRVSLEKARREAEDELRRQAREAESAAEAAALRERAAEAQRQVIDRLGEALSGIARKRLDDEIPADYARVREDFNLAVGQLAEAMEAVSMASQAVRSGVTEISGAAAGLSERTERQAAQLEETAAALAAITAAMQQTARGVGEVETAATEATAEADGSDEIVRRAIEAMSRIETSSREISQIIGVIDEIAFQTNLLALNAGVEAARAGEAGRGFAVVASEVRALAQRSADSAKKIKGLISASASHVGAGVEQVGAAGKALDGIRGRLSQINRAVGEIAVSAKQQASGLSEVNAAVGQMDQMTQQNAEMAQEATTAARGLTEQCAHLVQEIAAFRLTRDAGARVTDWAA